MASRMFTAVLPPSKVMAELDALLAPRRPFGEGWRWTPPEHWHLTTAFLPEVDEHASLELAERLAEVASDTQPFELRLAGARCFPDVTRARVLALGVGVGHDELAHLSQRCRQAASRAGVAADGTRFTGHLTLARANRGSNATPWVQVLDSFPGWTWQVESLSLVISHLAQHRHEITEQWTLGQPVDA